MSDDKRGDDAYFQAILAELDNGGRSALLGFLLARTVNWAALRHVPKTAEKQLQQNLSMGSLDPHLEWWMERLYMGELTDVLGWPEFVPSRVIYELYDNWMTKQRKRRMSIVEFSRVMLRFFTAGPGSKLKRLGKDVIRGYDVRPLDDARNHFDLELGSSQDWPEDRSVTNQRPF